MVNKITAYVTIGMPFSGKTEYAEDLHDKNSESVILDRGKIRSEVLEQFYTSKSTPEIEKFVSKKYYEFIEDAFNGGMDLIISDTNLRTSYLNATLDKLRDFDHVYLLDFRGVSLEQIIEANNINISGHHNIEKLQKLHKEVYKPELKKYNPYWSLWNRKEI